MMEKNIHADNHYISQGYLKRWNSSHKEVFVYSILVSHENVPLWKKKSAKGIAYHPHLYTRKIAGTESDEIEEWFSKEFESPAENVIQKVVSNQRLTPDDWLKLVRFLAMSDVRTPARLVEHLKTCGQIYSEVLESVLKELPEKLRNMKKSNSFPPTAQIPSGILPLRVTTEIKEGEEFGVLKAETAVGRASWLWSVKYLLENTANVLHQHKWTILQPADGMHWFTSDKPVVRLNYYGVGKYDFGGGWGKPGTELFMLLSPKHLLYTKIGSRPPLRDAILSVEQTRLIRHLLAEHAHRYIFANTADVEVPSLIPRTVNTEFFKHKEEQWSKWHAEQSESEEYLLTKG